MWSLYVYGEGQGEKIILSQLDRVINHGDEVFNMPEGKQLRDYLSIEAVAENFLLTLSRPE